MDKLIKESVMLTFKKEGFQLPYSRKWMGGYWSSPRWESTLTGKTQNGKIIIHTEDSYNLILSLKCLRGTIDKLYNDIHTTIATLKKSGEKGALLDNLIERNDWYVIFLDYLDQMDD